MLDPFVFRILCGLLAIGQLVGIFLFARASRSRVESKDVRAARPGGVLVNQVWLLLLPLPLIFLLVGAAVPSWVYGTPLNLVFPGGEFVQVAGIVLYIGGAALATSSVRALGRFMRLEIEVRSDHELVTRGPYSRIRHPAYTAFLLLDAAFALFFLHVILIGVFIARFAIAEVRARREEELLASPEGFGDRYREYMSRTGRFLPRFRKIDSEEL